MTQIWCYDKRRWLIVLKNKYIAESMGLKISVEIIWIVPFMHILLMWLASI